MRTVDAIWEKRNLGVDCREFTVEDGDAAGDVMDVLASKATQYMVVKTPVARTDVMFELCRRGYVFIECSIHATYDMREARLSPIERRLADAVEYCPMDVNDLDFLYEKIRGGLFKTDRISLDPYFTQTQSANRYVCWIGDEISRGADCYKMSYKGRPVGFFTIKSLGDGVYYPFLASMYYDREFFGLGFNITYKPICEILRRGGKLLSTYYSSNNYTALDVAAAMGLLFKRFHYVYVKHND